MASKDESICCEEFPRWYFLDTGILLRRLKEVEISADIDGADKDKAVADWIRSLALELACQIDRPSDPAAMTIVGNTKRRMRRYSHPGNDSGKRGRPKKNKEVMEDEAQDVD